MSEKIKKMRVQHRRKIGGKNGNIKHGMRKENKEEKRGRKEKIREERERKKEKRKERRVYEPV